MTNASPVEPVNRNALMTPSPKVTRFIRLMQVNARNVATILHNVRKSVPWKPASLLNSQKKILSETEAFSFCSPGVSCPHLSPFRTYPYIICVLYFKNMTLFLCLTLLISNLRLIFSPEGDRVELFFVKLRLASDG